MSVVGVEDMTLEKIPKWETELWFHISKGDGINCPVYDGCKTKQHGGWCFDDNKEKLSGLYGTHVIDSNNDENELDAFRGLFGHVFPRKWEPGIIFQLVEALATKYVKKAELNQPPITTELIRQFDISPGIEIHLLPLKAYDGAVWRLEDGWVIHVNAADKPTRQRVTLFHEAFHILAHRRATPIFRRRGIKEGSFNEMLADYFARCVLMPREWVKEKWIESKDFKRIAEIFQVTQVSVWIRLKTMGLV